MRHIGLSAWTLLGLLALSCEQRNTLDGAELSVLRRPDQGIYESHTLIAYDEKTDSINSSNPYFTKTLGVIADPVFGKLKASFAAQLTLSRPDLDFGENPVLDSVVFNAPLKARGGEDPYRYAIIPYSDGGFKPFTIKAYEITGAMKPADVVTYSNHRYELGDVIGQATYYKPSRDSLEIEVEGEKKKIAPAIRISLADSSDDTHRGYLKYFRNKFLDDQRIHFVNNASFRAYFKGIYVTTDDVDGSLVRFDGHDAALIFYFRNGDDSRVVAFPVEMSASQVGIYESDIDQAAPQLVKQLEAPDRVAGEGVLYIAGLGGPKAVIQLFSDADFKETKGKAENWAIQEARLIIHAKPLQTTPLPPALALINTKTGDPIPSGVASLNSEDNTYTFHLATYVSQILRDSDTCDPIDLVAAEFIRTPDGYKLSQNTPFQAEVDGNLGEHPIEFQIFYTERVL